MYLDSAQFQGSECHSLMSEFDQIQFEPRNSEFTRSVIPSELDDSQPHFRQILCNFAKYVRF